MASPDQVGMLRAPLTTLRLFTKSCIGMVGQ